MFWFDGILWCLSFQVEHFFSTRLPSKLEVRHQRVLMVPPSSPLLPNPRKPVQHNLWRPFLNQTETNPFEIHTFARDITAIMQFAGVIFEGQIETVSFINQLINYFFTAPQFGGMKNSFRFENSVEIWEKKFSQSLHFACTFCFVFPYVWWIIDYKIFETFS